MDLHPDWKEFIELLNAHGVEYVVVGAYAVSFYASPRFTSDIDFVVRHTEENAGRFRAALSEFGINLTEAESRKLNLPNYMIQLGRVPYRIDILTSVDGVDTEDLYRERVAGKLGGVKVSFPKREHLIAAKRAANRPKDQDDLRRLERKPKR